jgi:isopentenyl phosphate kinase
LGKQLIPTIVKLGGSVVTVKDKPFTPNLSVIERLAREIAEARNGSLVILHGGGSFGHYAAKEYQIASGYTSPEQLIGFAKTRLAMMTLNKLIVDALIGKDLPSVTVQPSACTVTKRGQIPHPEFNVVVKMLKMKLIPVLYGDAVLDQVMGFTILSGDRLATSLALELKAQNIIVGVDVDGLYTEDPKLNPNAKLIEKITVEALKRRIVKIGNARTTDVTGGMRGKLFELDDDSTVDRND